MKLRSVAAALALAILLAGCTGVVKEPATSPPPAQGDQNSGEAAKTEWPNSIGAYREGLGPGLVLQGYTSLDKVKVEVQVGGKTVRAEEVSSKDGGPGYWSLTWPAPAETDAEVRLVNPADGTVLASGALSPAMQVGLFHSSLFADTRIDAKASDRSKLRLAGKVKTGERVRVEFRDPTGKLSSAETVDVTQGAFEAELAWPDGASHVYFYALGSKETPQLGLIIPIIAR